MFFVRLMDFLVVLPLSCSFKCNRNPHIDFSFFRKTTKTGKNRVDKKKRNAQHEKYKKKGSRTNEVWQPCFYFTDDKRRSKEKTESQRTRNYRSCV